MLPEAGGRTSHRHLSEAQRTKVRDEIVRVDPFSINRDKVEFYDKPRGMFSGLTEEQITRFLTRNKAHHKRNSPHRMRMEEKMDIESVEKVDYSGEGPLADGGVGDGQCVNAGVGCDKDESPVGERTRGTSDGGGSVQTGSAGGGSSQAGSAGGGSAQAGGAGGGSAQAGSVGGGSFQAGCAGGGGSVLGSKALGGRTLYGGVHGSRAEGGRDLGGAAEGCSAGGWQC